MQKFYRHTHIQLIDLAISVLLGAFLAWAVKDDITPLLSGGYSFDERSLIVRVFYLAVFTLFFALIVFFGLWLNRSLNNDSWFKPRAFLALLGGLLGGLIFYLVYGTGTLEVGSTDWLFRLGDDAQHYLGWVFFRNDPWTFPIGFSQSLGYPGGWCMCFTDSIPLMAMPLKLASGLLPETFQFFGWWTLLCYVLQGALSALILYEVTRSRLAAVIAPLFFCTADILLYRTFRYTPLTGQWIVLLALYLFFLNRRTNRWNWLWPLVHSVAVLIQGYFFVMTFVVFLGALLERALMDKKWLPALLQTFLSLASTLLVMWLVGFFSESVEMSDAGLGYFKANLNALINPLEGWSRFFAPLPLAPDTYPNVNYLGAGMILLVLLGLPSLIFRRMDSEKSFLLRQAGLLFIILLLFTFSLSNVVTWNEHTLFTYTLPEPLMRLWGVFRGTERMLWPVYYLLFIFGISRVFAWRWRGWVPAVILLSALGIQLVEVFPILNNFQNNFSDPQGKQTNLRSAFWEDAAANYDSLYILPLNLDNWARLAEFAGDNRLNINYAYFARQSPSLEINARQKMDDLREGKSVKGEMYVIKSPELLKTVCKEFGTREFLGYVNGEWVLAPGFNKQPDDYPEVAITGTNSNCEQLALPDFLEKYREKIMVFSVMHDASNVVDEKSASLLKSFGLRDDLRQIPGMSYAAVTFGGKVISEESDEGRVEFSILHGQTVNNIFVPVTIEIVSAGEISGEEDSIIKINGRDFSYHRYGLNIAVIDPATGRVLDTGLFVPDD
jgi:hypothetical protein